MEVNRARTNQRADQLRKFDEILELFYRQSPVEEANAAITRTVDDFNGFVEKENSLLEVERGNLDRHLESIRNLESEIAKLDLRLNREKPDPQDAATIDTYNRIVGERNTLVEQHRGRADRFKQEEAAYNSRVEQFNREVDRRRGEVEKVKRAAAEKVEVYRRWIEQRGPEQFFAELNRFYASLHQEARLKGKGQEELEEYIPRVRRIRMELGSRTQIQQEEMENGFLIVQAELCQGEPSYLVIDIAASVTSITEEMVDVLGIREHVGGEMELLLPNAIRIKAPQLLIPSISVEGMGAEYIKGVVLKESMVGVDGCLGLSFLNRFDCTIELDRPRKRFVLKPKRAEGRVTFDIFICHKSEDLGFAERVFDTLAKAGYRPFLSEKSLARLGTTEFQKAIDTALENCQHLVLVCSSLQNINAPWVEAEWRLFDALKRSGKKEGNIVPVFCGEIDPYDLPLALRRYQTISIDDPNFPKTVVDYLPRL